MSLRGNVCLLRFLTVLWEQDTSLCFREPTTDAESSKSFFGSRLAAVTSKTKMRTVSVGGLPFLSADVGENIKISVGIA